MPELLRLTGTDGRTIFVNPNFIQCICEPLSGTTGKAKAYVVFSEDDYLAVTQTPESISDHFEIHEVE